MIQTKQNIGKVSKNDLNIRTESWKQLTSKEKNPEAIAQNAAILAQNLASELTDNQVNEIINVARQMPEDLNEDHDAVIGRAHELNGPSLGGLGMRENAIAACEIVANPIARQAMLTAHDDGHSGDERDILSHACQLQTAAAAINMSTALLGAAQTQPPAQTGSKRIITTETTESLPALPKNSRITGTHQHKQTAHQKDREIAENTAMNLNRGAENYANAAREQVAARQQQISAASKAGGIVKTAKKARKIGKKVALAGSLTGAGLLGLLV